MVRGGRGRFRSCRSRLPSTRWSGGAVARWRDPPTARLPGGPGRLPPPPRLRAGFSGRRPRCLAVTPPVLRGRWSGPRAGSPDRGSRTEGTRNGWHHRNERRGSGPTGRSQVCRAARPGSPVAAERRGASWRPVERAPRRTCCRVIALPGDRRAPAALVRAAVRPASPSGRVTGGLRVRRRVARGLVAAVRGAGSAVRVTLLRPRCARRRVGTCGQGGATRLAVLLLRVAPRTRDRGGSRARRPERGPGPRACGTTCGRASSPCPRTGRARGRSGRCSCPGSCRAAPGAPAR